MKKVLSFLLVSWHLAQAALAIDTLESTPNHIDGQLLACVGDRVSLTCSRTDGSSGVTRWIIHSSTISCNSVISHSTPVSVEPCDNFMFENVTEITESVNIDRLSSTAVATVNASVSGAVIQCFNSRFSQFSRQIGPNITLCIPDQLFPPENVQVELMANGTVQIAWNRPPGICSERNISYVINLVPADGNSIDEGIGLPTITSGTSIMFDLTPGREYSALLTASNTDCSIFSSVIAKNFTAMQDAATTTDTPTTFASTEKTTTTQTIQTSAALSQSTVTIIIIVVIVVVIIILVILVVVIWYFFYWRPKLLRKHTSTADGNTELQVKSSEVDALVYDDPSPKFVSHVEAASGDLYAQPDRTDKKNADSQGAYQDPNSIKHEAAPTGDEYAMPQQTRKKKGKNQESSVDPVNANAPAMYATVDPSKKSQLMYAQLDVGSGSGGQPVPQSTSYATVVS